MTTTRRDLMKLSAGLAAGSLISLPARAATSVEIMAPYYKSLVTMAPMAVALENGLYLKHGVNVKDVLTSVGGGTGLRNMIAGNIGYAEVSTASVFAGIKAGLDLKIVHNSVRTVRDIVWVTKLDSPVKSIQDLSGKRIGISGPKSTSETLALMALERAGVKDAKLVAIGPIGAGLSALDTGGIDAAFIMEPLYTQRHDRYREAFNLDKLPLMSQNVGIATADFMSANGDTLRSLIAGRREAVDFIYANIDEAAKIVSKRYGATLPIEAAPAVIRRMAEIKYWSPGNIELESLETVVEGLRRQGDWDGPVDWSKVIDKSYLPADLQA